MERNLIKENQRLRDINEMLKKEIEVLSKLLSESNLENERIQRYVRELEDFMKVYDTPYSYIAY